ncbi:hypothetical protein BT96DRAFT_840775 [Gymnopus androsaceus JB14]|uniref:Uncharacterized protein n=1 Tax=Gymnopus androsaceus JB14 TaxID=1447944 RepID=A0A6A4GJ93_9AGAR|nr:hypothetical protein BT96DRAFT_840775 [Gymnopus androsaceus JB14]
MSWDILLNPLPSTVSGANDPSLAPLALLVAHNVQINRQTIVSELFHYAPSTRGEYPKTAPNNNAIGHLFDMDLSKEWVSPAQSFAYSQGTPDGARSFVFTKVLVNSDGNEVPCNICYSTCQGVKICPSALPEILLQTHTSGSCFEWKLYLEQERQEQVLSLDRDLIEKTLNYWACLRDYGCGHDLQEETVYNAEELEHYNTIHASPKKKKLGHEPKATCKGCISLRCTPTSRPFLCCEHFDPKISQKHFCNFAIANEVYHTEYLLALCNADSNKIHKWEKLAFNNGYEPLAPCTTVQNFSTKQVDCSHQHWNPSGFMLMTEMVSLPCKSSFHIYKSLPDYCCQCPRILVVYSEEHAHPIPASTKTPPDVRSEILNMLYTTMIKDLVDMTPRRFLRHPVAQAFIRRKVPFVKEPQLSDQSMFPAGTGWEGLLEQKRVQEKERAPQDQYIRVMAEFLLPDVRSHVMDEDATEENSEKFRIVICMFPQRSHDLLKAQFVQSDISYKRVVGFKELEFVGWDEQSHTAIVYCRAYLTRESAAAHLVFFRLLDQLVLKDTGRSLMFRHLHSKSIGVKDREGILHWAIDQGRGPAKGMALYLQELAGKLPLHTRDLHQPHRYIHELEPYEHLHHVARLCTAHMHRNISNSKTIPEGVKPKMRSLMCVTHPSWDATVAQIESSGKAGRDWVADKTSSKFAFEAMCQEKSFIPLDIWKAGPATTNLVESAHWSVYLEGLQCSLTSAVEKGEHVDRLRMSSSNVSSAK